MSLIGAGARRYGDVSIGPGAVVEDGVVIGHPGADEIAAVRAAMRDYDDLAAFYAAAAQRPTVIGRDAIIRSGTVIYSGTTIGDSFDCGHGVLIRERVTIGDGVYVKSNTEIMRNCRVADGCRLAGVIADNSTLGSGASSFGTLTHAYERAYTPEMSRRPGPTLGAGAIVGRGAVLIGGVSVGDHAVVGANSVVNFDVPGGSLVVGVLAAPRGRRPR